MWTNFCGPKFKSPACRTRCSGERVETAWESRAVRRSKWIHLGA
jgi:hypothetical protein